MTAWEVVIVIVGMAVVTVVSRSFFFLGERELPLPRWLQQGLRYAPLAALTAVAAPEVVLTHGHLIDTWRDARPYAAAAAMAWFFWRPGVLGAIVVGSTVMLVLRLGLGWVGS
jgi:branched-subunit amino acid transport protein